MKLVDPKTRGVYRTDSPIEITRLKAAGYREEEQAEDLLYHPGEHKVGEVVAHMQENPLDVERVRAEELTGQQRTTILNYEKPPPLV